MHPWHDRQSRFVALLAATAGAPEDMRHGVTRFSVYRNNVAVALIEGLRVRFSVVNRLVGDEAFSVLARGFSLENRPQSPLMFNYGDGFGDHLAGLPGMEDVPYLPDVARLEELYTQAFHAADAEPLALAVLGTVDPERLPEMRLIPHPSLRLMRSAYPVASIWAAHQGTDTPEPPAHWEGEAMAVVRPDAEVLVHVMSAADHAFAEAITAGKTLGEAAEVGFDRDETFDFGRALVGLTGIGAFSGLGD